MSWTERVVVIGASGFGRESLDVLEAMRDDGDPVQILGVVDDSPTEENLQRLEDRGTPYLGTVENWIARKSLKARFVIGIGNPHVRKRVARRLETAGKVTYSAVHPKASIGKNSIVSPGAVVCAGAVISTNVRFGRYVHINPNATVGHDAILEDYVSINPAAVISGEVKIRQNVLVGAAALVLQQLEVGDDSIVGAAALVTKDVPAHVVVKGVPGKWAPLKD